MSFDIDRLLPQITRLVGLTAMLVLCVTTSGQAQYSLSRFFDLHDGMAPGWVNDISQDSIGNLWLCNRNGLSKFDGHNFVSYYANAGDSLSLKAAETFDIAHLQNGDAWVATARGLSKFHRTSNTFTTFTVADGLTLEPVRKILPEGDTILWTGHWWGLDRIDLSTMQVQNYRPFPARHDSALLFQSLNSVYALKRCPYTDRVFSAHTKSLFYFDDLKDTLIEVLPEKPWELSYIADFDWLNDSIIVLAMVERDFIVELNINTHSTRKISLPGVSQLKKVLRIAAGKLLLLDGIAGILEYPVRHENATFTGIPAESAQQVSSYHSLLQDRAGRRWIGTQSGLALFEDDPVFTYQSGEQIDIFSAVYDSTSGLCITNGYIGSLLWKIADRQFAEMPYDFTETSPWSIVFSPQQEHFYSIENDRLIAFHPTRDINKEIRLSSPVDNRIISSVTTDANGFLFAHGSQLLRISYTGTVDTVFQNDERIFSFTRHGAALYFSELGKIKKFNSKGDVETIYNKNPLVPPRDLVVVADTALWFSQIHAGLVKILLTSADHPTTIYGTDRGVISQAIHAIKKNANVLLLSGSFCILTFDLVTEQVTDVFIHSNEQLLTQFSQEIHVLDDRHYFTSDARGIVVFPRNKTLDALYGMRSQYIRVADRNPEYHTAQPLKLTYRENDISVLLETCYFGKRDELRYAYKLKPGDPWTEVGSAPLLNFTNLAPAHYTLQARVSTREGQTAVLQEPIEVHIAPPWWATWWFRALCALTILAALVLSSRRRIARLKAKHAVETKLIRLEQVALKSQMNPHFLFNCLNGIRTLITLKEDAQAVAYVNHLSRLLRDTLLHHEDASITLGKELEMTENYLTLGKLRFGDKVNWKVHIDPEVDLMNIPVPPFVLQPLVENAIWHGIKHLETDGMIEIHVRNKSDQIVIEVLDNGIGLHKSKQIQMSDLRTRKHIGISLVKKRLEAMHGRLVIRERDNSSGVACIIYLNTSEHA